MKPSLGLVRNHTIGNRGVRGKREILARTGDSGIEVELAPAPGAASALDDQGWTRLLLRASAAGQGGFSFVDLDTPLFMAENPFDGGMLYQGGRIELGQIQAGHGVTPKDPRVPRGRSRHHGRLYRYAPAASAHLLASLVRLCGR